MTRLPSGLLLITDREQARLPLTDICSAALEAGFVGLLVREKDLDGGALYALASPLSDLCRALGKACLVNDRLDVALSIPGPGAHVGKNGMPVALARGLLGPERLLGYSAHEASEAAEALSHGADYVTVSPIFSSRSKPHLAVRGTAFLRECVEKLPRGRVVALGGIDAGNLVDVRRAGTHGAAIMGEVMRAANPRETAASLVAAWDNAN